MAALVAATAALVLLLCPSEATARWQYTKWGMKPGEVATASRGQAASTSVQERADQSAPDSEDEPLLKAPFQSGRFQFVAFFHFNKQSGDLSSVELHLQNSSLGPELLGSLRLKYGKAESEKRSDYLQLVVWQRDDDQVAYMGVVGKHFSVTYQPLRTKNNEGL